MSREDIEAWMRLREASKRGDTDYLRRGLTDPTLRDSAAAFLADNDCVEAAPDIARLLDTNDPLPRIAAVRALGRLRAREYATDLRERAKTDPHRQVRLWSITAIGDLGDRDERQFLEGLLDDPDRSTRAVVVAALGALGDPAALPALLRARRRDLLNVVLPLRSGQAYRRAIRSLRSR